MNQEIRNKLRNVVTQCRRLLEESILQDLEGKYGIFAKKDVVTADPNAKMAHLSEEEQASRKDILDHFGHIKARGFKPKEALDQLVREIAFTHLNRLCAYKMMEAREVYVGGQKFREAVSRGFNSNGVKFYLADHPEEERLFNTGHQDIAYRHFLDWLGGCLSDEIGILFNPNDPANRLYPRQKTLDEVLDLLNSGGIKPEETELREEWPKIWLQDETIGWAYQYFTPKELRDAARDPKQGGSQAPRNSYELAFRNQFFTPRYVVEFLTDNTLGRIWYEMRKGETKLADQCRYLVRRPTEIFLEEGEHPPKAAIEAQDDLSQEELLKLPAHILHRAKKDPRELRILDPASGSGHFLLYCFDLLLTIYNEAYIDAELGPALQRDYPTFQDLRRCVPQLILAHNLHGIDIDVRASQIAALALWLRCQRAYQDMGLKKDRPQITRSNFVCAEPMPGEELMLKEFVGQLEPRFLGQVVEVVFDKMTLAGEVGSLLKIEEEIRDAVGAAKKQWIRETTQAKDRKGQPLLFTQLVMDRLAGKREQPSLFDLSDITDDQFFEQAEAKVIETLRQYAEKAQNGQKFQKRLFTEDAVRGFAFVDLCHKRYDVVLMNPPFGEGSKPSKAYLQVKYSKTKNDLYASFVARWLDRITPAGILGTITSRTGFFLSSFEAWRQDTLDCCKRMRTLVDLGSGTLDSAAVETAAYTLSLERAKTLWVCKVDDLEPADRANALLETVEGLKPSRRFVLRSTTWEPIPGNRLLYWVPKSLLLAFSRFPSIKDSGYLACVGLQTNDDFRFVRASWEVPRHLIGKDKYWATFFKGGEYCPFFDDFYLVVNWDGEGRDIKQYTISLGNSPSRHVVNEPYYFHAGLAYTNISSIGFSLQPMPSETVFSIQGQYLGALKSQPPFGVLTSRTVAALLDVINPGRHYQAGQVQIAPVPNDTAERSTLNAAAFSISRMKREQASWCEESRIFGSMPVVSGNRTLMMAAEDMLDRIAKHRKDISALCEVIDTGSYKLYELDDEGIEFVKRETERARASRGTFLISSLSGDVENVAACARWLSHSVMSICIGCIFLRWESSRVFIAQSDGQDLDFLDALPTYAPAMVVPSNTTKDLQAHSTPSWAEPDGILPDDPDRPDDLVRRVREVAETVWKERADAIETEACGILGVQQLRDYFRKIGKGGFWDDHVSRYSKARRKAPIYWLLQSTMKNYALWLYYHRLNKDSLFKALVNYVEPKIRLESSRLDTLRSQRALAGEAGKESKRLANEAESQEDLLSELKDFEDKLRRAANLHLEPDLNDGVVLNIAPLHELVPWQEAEKYWEELLEGKYEWSSIGKQLRQKGLVK